MSVLAIFSLVASTAPLFACSDKVKDPWAGISDRMREKAQRIYGARCENCHGKTGAGDGPEAHKCNPRPRSFHVKGWQRSVTNDEIERSIVGGGAAIKKSVIMPPNPDLRDRTELVQAMRAYVRALANKTKAP